MIDIKLTSDFVERFFLNAVTPPILLLLIFAIIKWKKVDFKISSYLPISIIFYLSIDLSMRIYYTFILKMENQTRYFIPLALFSIIPAVAAWNYLIDKSQFNKQKWLGFIGLIIFVFGVFEAFKSERHKSEIELFCKIIADDPAKLKIVEQLKYEKDGTLVKVDDYRFMYYAGIYPSKRLKSYVVKGKGAIYYIVNRDIEVLGDVKLKKVAQTEGDKIKYLYKVIN